MKKTFSKKGLKKRVLLLIILFVLTLSGGMSAILYRSKMKADVTSPKAAALHLYHDNVTPSTPAGQATSGYAIPKNVINNDFTIRISLKAGEYDMWNSNILSIEGNGNDMCGTNNGWRKRFQFWHDSSPISHLDFHTDPCNASPYGSNGPSSFGERANGGTRTQQTYEDYFVVYKKPITGVQDGYWRVYRALDENGSIIPQGMDYAKANGDNYLNYTIDKSATGDWLGNDENFRIVLGDTTNQLLDLGKVWGAAWNGHIYGGQDIKISELTMWTKALDSDMGILPSDPTYYGKYYGREGNFDKYQSAIINGLTHQALANVAPSYQSDLYFHFGNSDEGIETNTWKNDVATAPAGIDISFSGPASLTSDVPNWESSNYPASSTTRPVVTPLDFTLEKISATQLKISNIPAGNPQGNSFGLEVKKRVYVSTSSADYKYTAIKNYVLDGNTSELLIDGVEADTTHYYVTIEWIDKLENKTFLTKDLNNLVSDSVFNDSYSLHFTNNPNNQLARADIPYKLPVNKPSTFRVLFKLNRAPDPNQETAIFGVYDRLRVEEGYQYITIFARNDGGNTKALFRIADGDKYLRFNQSSNLMFTGDSEIRIGEWEEFWFTYVQPTSQTEGGLYVYRYKRDINSFETVYNNTNPLPKVTSWFTDWNFKKWETRIYYGSSYNDSPADFLVNQATWWDKALTHDEISAIAGNSINKLPKNTRQDDALFWHTNPKVEGALIEPTIGTYIGAHKTATKCVAPSGDTYVDTNCTTVSDIPTFLNSNEGNISITMPNNQSTYTTKSITLSAQVSNADTISWSKSSGPSGGEITFSSPSAATTNVSFNQIGTYVLNLTATDTANNTATRQVTITVNKTGDINGKDGVNFDDFTLLLANWGTPNNPMADINGDGTVDFQNDFTLLLFSWGP